CHRAEEDGGQAHLAGGERTPPPGGRTVQLRGCGLVSAEERDADEAKPPRLTDQLFGHAGIEAALLAAYRGGRVPHAFMLIGQKGIGKATLAYRLARFVLAHPDPAAPAVHAANSLAGRPEHPGAGGIAAPA